MIQYHGLNKCKNTLQIIAGKQNIFELTGYLVLNHHDAATLYEFHMMMTQNKVL